MTANIRFGVFILVSFVAFIGLILFIFRGRQSSEPSLVQLLAVTSIVVIGGMIFAKYGQNFGLPWWIYYTIPALLTLFLPPIAFQMTKSEIVPYLCLSFLVSPLIHVVFSFFIGWKEYMPFIPIPSIQELLR